MGNALSFIALAAWPLVCLAAFARFKPNVAVIISFMGAMLFLPEKVEIKAPFQPLDKVCMASIGALLGVLLVGEARRKLWKARPFLGSEIWVFLIMVGAFGTSFTNQEPLNYGMASLQPLNTWEAVSVCVGDVYNYLIPWIIGRAIFTDREDARVLLKSFQIGAVIYLPFIMVEIVMSPQMHNWVYGFAQHDFIQTMRAGGYRPMVFMGHGLGLTLFLAAAILAGMVLTLARRATFFRLRARWVSLFLLLVLLGCKSLGAAVFAFLFTAVLTFMTPRWQLRVLVFSSTLVVFYPVSRATEAFPHKEIVQFIKDTAGADRAQSLEFRFDNEAELGKHAAKKPWFGWGRYRRNMLFSPWKDEPISVSDGYWIIIYGVRGVLGFVCLFGMFLTPVFFLRKRIKRLQAAEDRYLLVGLACISMMYTIDLLPNGMFTNYNVFFAGAVVGLIRGISGSSGEQAAVTVTVTTTNAGAPPEPKLVTSTTPATRAPQPPRGA
ncbi:MAG: hypothetical protein FJ137_01465 [Deltaproteobacteria bacterium]|nr:hypothetical protein [Deltaproteobacteria bacterium]